VTAASFPASAYTCLTETPFERFSRAEVVFEGIVAKGGSLKEASISQPAIEAMKDKAIGRDTPTENIGVTEIIVTETFKGETSRLQELWSDSWGYGAGYGFQPPFRAVFFANYSDTDGILITDPCLALYHLREGDEYRILTAKDLWFELTKFDLD